MTATSAPISNKEFFFFNVHGKKIEFSWSLTRTNVTSDWLKKLLSLNQTPYVPSINSNTEKKKQQQNNYDNAGQKHKSRV